MAKRFMTPEEVRLPDTVISDDDSRPYTELETREDFQHESFKLENPPYITTIPEGTHPAEIVKLRRAEAPSFTDPTVMEDKIIVLFKTEYGNIQKTMNLKFHELSTLGHFLNATLGEIPASIDSDDLIGRKVKITILHKEKGENTYANIVDFKRMK